MTRRLRQTSEALSALRTRLLVDASPEAQARAIASMSPLDALKFDADFETWAHRNQLPPPEDGWRVWLMMAGRGFGKTRAGAEWICRLAAGKAGVRIALVGANIADARSVMVEGVSGILKVSRAHRRRVKWEPSLNRLTWPNGSVAELYSGDNADGLRGPEFDFAWCDELAKWRQGEEAWANVQFALRRGPRPRALVTTTPRSCDALKAVMGQPATVITRGRTSDNINLDEGVIAQLTAAYAGTRIGRQELDGEMLDDFEGALWTRELIERSRAQPLMLGCDATGDEGAAAAGMLRQAFGVPTPMQAFERIVVGVDPPAGASAASDACGIVVVGEAAGVLHVLADASVQGLSPEGWSNRVAATAARWGTSRVVAEANNGGAMVGSVLLAADSGLNVRLVHASIGKSARAEPVALRFEKGSAKLAGYFPELEAQLCGMIAGGGYEGPGRSPDRADAMVWAMTALGESRSGVPRVRRL
jgi:phage terminase large subunit-like protein